MKHLTIMLWYGGGWLPIYNHAQYNLYNVNFWYNLKL